MYTQRWAFVFQQVKIINFYIILYPLKTSDHKHLEFIQFLYKKKNLIKIQTTNQQINLTYTNFFLYFFLYLEPVKVSSYCVICIFRFKSLRHPWIFWCNIGYIVKMVLNSWWYQETACIILLGAFNHYFTSISAFLVNKNTNTRPRLRFSFGATLFERSFS